MIGCVAHLLKFGLANGLAPGDGTGHTPTWALVIHILTVVAAVPLGAYVVFKEEGDARLKLLGRSWTLITLVASIYSYWIRGSGHLGPLHIFSIITLIAIFRGVYHIRGGRVEKHRRSMLNAYIGLCGAGIFALLPGRLIGNLIWW